MTIYISRPQYSLGRPPFSLDDVRDARTSALRIAGLAFFAITVAGMIVLLLWRAETATGSGAAGVDCRPEQPSANVVGCTPRVQP